MKNKIKLFLFVFLILGINSLVFSDTVKDVMEIRLDVKQVFSLSIDTFMNPFVAPYNPEDLFQPSQNTIVPGKNLNGVIDLGHLIARKKGDKIFPLVSEYRVLMKVRCETNRNREYLLTQELNGPLTGVKSGEIFPEKAFVYIAGINKDEGQETGEIMLKWESPVMPNDSETIYMSGKSENDYLGNTINVWYWVSAEQDDKVEITQRADTYKSTLTITMVEL